MSVAANPVRKTDIQRVLKRAQTRAGTQPSASRVR